jgi:hypothetical protein
MVLCIMPSRSGVGHLRRVIADDYAVAMVALLGDVEDGDFA